MARDEFWDALKEHAHRNHQERVSKNPDRIAYAIQQFETHGIEYHKHGKKHDCRASQLEWATISENTKHAWDHGLIRRGGGEKPWPVKRTLKPA